MFEVIQVNPVFTKLAGKEIPLRAAYSLNKIAEAVDKESSFYFNMLKKIFEKYGDVDSNGEPIFSDEGKRMRKVKEVYREVAQKELNELGAMEVTFDDRLKIPIESLEKIEISIDELHPLLPFLID